MVVEVFAVLQVRVQLERAEHDGAGPEQRAAGLDHMAAALQVTVGTDHDVRADERDSEGVEPLSGARRRRRGDDPQRFDHLDHPFALDEQDEPAARRLLKRAWQPVQHSFDLAEPVDPPAMLEPLLPYGFRAVGAVEPHGAVYGFAGRVHVLVLVAGDDPGRRSTSTASWS